MFHSPILEMSCVIRKGGGNGEKSGIGSLVFASIKSSGLLYHKKLSNLETGI